jgi:hypothetical protein
MGAERIRTAANRQIEAVIRHRLLLWLHAVSFLPLGCAILDHRRGAGSPVTRNIG